jgi:hypothetical protein
MFYSYRAMVWAGKVGISCTIDSARMLRNKLLCSRHFSKSDFTTAEMVHLNRVAVPCSSDSAAQSLPQPPEPSFHTPSFDPLPSVLTPEDDLHVKFDCIEGFEDRGSQGRTCNIANHALLFMICGLCKKWKQPVAYYFTRGSTKAEVIVQYLKEVLDAC